MIPEDWQVCRLDSLGDWPIPPIKAGPFGSSLTKDTYVPTGYKVYGQEQVICGDHQYGDYFITKKKFRELESCAVRPGDVLLSLVGTVGKLLEIPDGAPPGIINPRLIRFSFDKARVCPTFFRFLFESDQVQGLLARKAQGGTMGVLNAGVLRPFCIQVPPPTEQRAIAEALSDVDGLLGALEAVIAKKLVIKRAALQQLLTGKTRLPGYSGEWETKRLGEIGSFSKGRGIKRDDVCLDGLPCIRYGELYTQYHNYVMTPLSRISPAVARTAFPIKAGDLLFAASGETAEEIGSCAAYLGDEQAFAGGDIIVLTPSRHNSMYLGHLMNHPLVATQKARLGQGDAVVHISARNLARVEIDLPPVEEQTAIGTVLSDMDAEIAALERRRGKTRAIKQGMMQQLLTGRVRLIEPEAATAR